MTQHEIILETVSNKRHLNTIFIGDSEHYQPPAAPEFLHTDEKKACLERKCSWRWFLLATIYEGPIL
jgi:hypothetical protein